MYLNTINEDYRDEARKLRRRTSDEVGIGQPEPSPSPSVGAGDRTPSTPAPAGGPSLSMVAEIFNTARRVHGAQKWAQATGITGDVTSKKLSSDIKKYPGERQKIIDILLLQGVYRFVVAAVNKGFDARAQFIKDQVNITESNPELQKWFVQKLITDNNFGVIAEKTYNDDKKGRVIELLSKS